MNPVYEKLQKCYESYKAKIDFTPKVALVLGSGLGDYADDIRVVDTLDYHDIEGFPVSTVPGHKGRFIFGYVGEVPVVCMQGRVHYYEGYDMSDVVLPARLMKLMGAEVLFLTNAAGGIQLGMNAGDFMLIKDQIASFVPSPLRGANVDELGVRFPDMSQVYDKELQLLVKKAALGLDIDLKEGTYLQLSGPQFETPKEVAMCRTLGADAVGMSTAMADVLNIAGTDALLAGGDPVAGRLLLAGEEGLHGRHTGVDQQQRRVILRDQGKAGQTQMVFGLKEVQEHFPQLIETVVLGLRHNHFLHFLCKLLDF